MLRNLRQKLYRWLRDANEEQVDLEDRQYKYGRGKSNLGGSNVLRVAEEDTPGELRSKNIKFYVYPAAGGSVIQIRAYDTRQESMVYHLHVVPESEDLAQALAHILTLEAMRVNN